MGLAMMLIACSAIKQYDLVVYQNTIWDVTHGRINSAPYLEIPATYDGETKTTTERRFKSWGNSETETYYANVDQLTLYALKKDRFETDKYEQLIGKSKDEADKLAANDNLTVNPVTTDDQSDSEDSRRRRLLKQAERLFGDALLA